MYFLRPFGNNASLLTALLRKLSVILLLGFGLSAPISLANAEDFVEQEDDGDKWEFSGFANIFHMFNTPGTGGGGGILAQDNPLSNTFTGATGPSTQTLTAGDAFSDTGLLLELGASLYRNNFGLSGSLMFSPGSGGGGSSSMGYKPLSHGGIAGNPTGTPFPTANDAANISLGFANFSVGPVRSGTYQSVYGGVSISANENLFRSYEVAFNLRQKIACHDGDTECECEDLAAHECEPRWNIGIGPRLFELSQSIGLELEAYNRNFQGAVTSNTYTYMNLDIEASNKIYGVQLSGEYKVLRNFKDRLDLTVGGKLGFGINDITARVGGSGLYRADAPATLLSFGADASGQKNTMFGQLDIGASFDLSKNIEISAGYRALWIENVATLGSQMSGFDVQANSAGTSKLVTDDMLLHMGRIGLKVTF